MVHVTRIRCHVRAISLQSTCFVENFTEDHRSSGFLITDLLFTLVKPPVKLNL